jgi:hypothetical protein
VRRLREEVMKGWSDERNPEGWMQTAVMTSSASTLQGGVRGVP